MEQMFLVFGFTVAGVIGSAIGATIAAPIAYWLGRHFKVISAKFEE